MVVVTLSLVLLVGVAEQVVIAHRLERQVADRLLNPRWVLFLEPLIP